VLHIPDEQLSTPLQKFTNVFFGLARSRGFGEEFREVLTGEFPFEGTSCSLSLVLKIEKALGDSVEVVEVIGRQDLPPDDREVDLIEPPGVNWGMHQRQAG
jgi:hypothetical protein